MGRVHQRVADPEHGALAKSDENQPVHRAVDRGR